MIDVAIGQSKLLINNKFKQFPNLINQCELQTERIACEDLHGFWDMLFIQVNNLQKRFENLTTLINNNWIEILPELQATKRPKRKPAKTKAKGKSTVSEPPNRKINNKRPQKPVDHSKPEALCKTNLSIRKAV